VAAASESRLKHYNKVLGEQLAELKAETEEAEVRWKIEFGLPTFLAADPRRLGGRARGREARPTRGPRGGGQGTADVRRRRGDARRTAFASGRRDAPANG
jgi:hypothetical protein